MIENSKFPRVAKRAEIKNYFTCAYPSGHWTLHGLDHLSVVYIETQGSDLDDMLCNALVSLEDWHGNPGPDWDLGDLPDQDYNAIVSLFVEHLAGA